jgi:hypothetical protein
MKSIAEMTTEELAAYFHWKDRQALEQAVLVAIAQRIDLDDVRRWSESEGSTPKFQVFTQRL